MDSQLIEEVTAHAQSDSLEMRERYAQTVLTFRITYLFILSFILSLWVMHDNSNVCILQLFMFSLCLPFYVMCPFFRSTNFRSVTCTPLPLIHFTFQPFSILSYFAVSSCSVYLVTLTVYLLLIHSTTRRLIP